MSIRSVILSLFIALLIESPVNAQELLDPFCNDSSYRVLLRVAGDNIHVSCDTVYLLNKATFSLLHGSYLDYQQQSNLISSFTDSVERYVSIYKDHVQEQQAQFDTLGLYYHRLSDSSKLLVNNANAKLQVINANLDTMQHIISNAETNLADVGEMVHRAEKKKWLFGAIGGAIGFSLGFIVATTVVLLATD